MTAIWDGITRADNLADFADSPRQVLADAAKAYDWRKVLPLLEANPELVNSCRLGGSSFYTPLHQAAHGGAPTEVVVDLIRAGAFRTIQNYRGERPVDVAERRGHRHLLEILAPQPCHQVPVGVLLRIQAHFHNVMRSEVEREITRGELRLPQLEPITELGDPEMWFPVPGMFGGFFYRLEDVGVGARLVVTSASKMEIGPGTKYEITSRGSRIMKEDAQ